MHTCMIHQVCFSVSPLVPLGPLMNRHGLPIKVKVMAVISARHDMSIVPLSDGRQQACTTAASSIIFLWSHICPCMLMLNTSGTLPSTWLIGHDCCLIAIRCCPITISSQLIEEQPPVSLSSLSYFLVAKLMYRNNLCFSVMC